MANANIFSTPQPNQQTSEYKHNEKKDLTDAQLCGYIIYWFHHFPNKAYLTFDEIYDRISMFSTATKEKVEESLMGLTYSCAITFGTFENKNQNIPLQKRWYWSIKMSQNDGEAPKHYREVGD